MSFTPGRVGLKIYQGADWDQIFIWQDSDGDPVSVAGMSARMHARLTIDDTQTVFTLTSADGGIVLGGAAGTVQPKLSAAQTTALAEPNADGMIAAVYDLELVRTATGEVIRLVQGNITIYNEVTRKAAP
jgi:hypothetical protein